MLHTSPPIQLIQPVQLTQPVEPVQPIQPVQLTQPVELVQPIQPNFEYTHLIMKYSIEVFLYSKYMCTFAAQF